MERHEIETFLTLAEELHFARTAERLHVSPGRVSQTIKTLERRIGSPLFTRTSRRVTLTPLGERFRDDLLPGHRQIQAAFANARAAGHGITGRLRIRFSSPWAGTALVRAADAVRTEHPECDIQIRELQHGDSYGPLRAGAVDLQLSELPVEEPDITVGPVIFSEPRALIVPVDHPLAGRESVSLDDLAHLPLIALAELPRYWSDFHYPHRTPSGEPIPRGPVAPDWQALLALVGAGKGVSPTAVRGTEYHARPDIAYIPFSDAPPIDFALLWKTDGETALLETFVQTMTALAPPLST
ncbi:LysR family transcriptional regulator [Actinomadura atramentaria]|uniref:LysR family transcriptional regulator n=1 Tax=Actinomadura atramentaria TaxID=1990 RepID=UPI0003A880B4|nr:LysR family transcriptional regulator [Actinomadura atramentaria]